MKYLFILSLGLVGAIAANVAIAQDNYQARSSQGNVDFLTPEPLSVRRPGAPSPDKSVIQTNKLNDVANSIQPKSGKSILTEIGLPEDLIRTPTQRSTNEDPLGFFQISPPTPSLGVNLRAN